jgi:CRP-like cAMP-binding protein
MITPGEKLFSFLSKQPQLTQEAALHLHEHWRTQRRLRRGDFLCALGKTEQHVWFVAEGVLRLYYPVEEEEVCVGFAYENNVLSSFPSYIRQQPSTFSIQALTDCTVLGISRSDFQQARERWPGVALFWGDLLAFALVGTIEREIEIATTTPEARYHNLLARAPHLFQLVPLKYIASYLRIKPETLSRVRAEASSKRSI